MKQKIKWPLRTFWVDLAYFIGGSILYSVGLYTFARQANFATGGISGLSLIFHHLWGTPLGLVSLLLNIPLVLISLRVLGPLFLVKSGVAMVCNTVFLDLVFPFLPVYEGNQLLAAMFTGVCMGAGLALVYMRGSSTGGTDFLVMSVKKLRPHISIGSINLACDLVIILLGGFVFGNVDAVLYGIVSSFAASMMMDNLMYGAGSGKLAIIVTDKGKAIAGAISNEIDRGSTLVQATGAYTGQGKDMLYCACGKSQVYKVRTAALAMDPGALVMVTEASEVFGEGFSLDDVNIEAAQNAAQSGPAASPNTQGPAPAKKGKGVKVDQSAGGEEHTGTLINTVDNAAGSAPEADKDA